MVKKVISVVAKASLIAVAVEAKLTLEEKEGQGTRRRFRKVNTQTKRQKRIFDYPYARCSDIGLKDLGLYYCGGGENVKTLAMDKHKSGAEVDLGKLPEEYAKLERERKALASGAASYKDEAKKAKAYKNLQEVSEKSRRIYVNSNFYWIIKHLYPRLVGTLLILPSPVHLKWSSLTIDKILILLYNGS
ncbi:unnamed protein product [Amoebophrya sp. A25]|nr:unnamed protein product [Amoebophrya sp. A25]|eukprot:GSA25T00020390001.1